MARFTWRWFLGCREGLSSLIPCHGAARSQVVEFEIESPRSGQFRLGSAQRLALPVNFDLMHFQFMQQRALLFWLSRLVSCWGVHKELICIVTRLGTASSFMSAAVFFGKIRQGRRTGFTPSLRVGRLLVDGQTTLHKKM